MTVRGENHRARSGVTSVGGCPRILAIDYGRKRMGMALSDELRLTARPLGILTRSNRRNDLRRLHEICRRHGVSKIVVGHPLQMTGARGDMAAEAERFAARLKEELGIPTELADERLTSWEARETLFDARSSRAKGAPVDDVAAAILLRQYLEERHDHGRSAAARKE